MKRIPKRHPIQIKMIGEEIAFFRGAQGQPVALRDACPHRGARLSEGTSHWKGTVSCPYHGWTFDENGKNVAVLSEGPDSKICGKPGTEAQVYPSRELKGIVFVWIGEDEPAPIEEDVPEEFFHPDAYILYNDKIYWRTNWAQALENYFDSHVSYLHRDDPNQTLLSRTGLTPRATPGSVASSFTGNGPNYLAPRGKPAPHHDIYPDGKRWPKHRFRRFWRGSSYLSSPSRGYPRLHLSTRIGGAETCACRAWHGSGWDTREPSDSTSAAADCWAG